MSVKKDGTVVYNNDDEILNKNVYDNHTIPFSLKDIESNKLKLDNIRLKGVHNHSNIAAALAISKIYNIDLKIFKQAIEEFNPLPHRLEYLLTFNNTKIYNDSKATNIAATIAAIKSFKSNIILILGGQNKGDIDFKELTNILKGKIVLSRYLKQLKDLKNGVSLLIKNIING